MEFTGLGGGVMLAIAAGLWMLYLLPSWLKRREYLATEMNAVRLQQTIRVLAETAEVPQIVKADAAARRQYNGRVSVGAPARPAPRAARPTLAVHRLRRTRLMTTLVLLTSVVVGIVQLGIMIGAGVVPEAWLVLGASTLGGLSSVAMLGQLAQVSRSRRQQVARPVRRTSVSAGSPATAAQRSGWTPVAVPKPLYLSKGANPSQPVTQTAAALDPVFELELAAASAERALRSRDLPPAIVPAAAALADTAAPSRFASMGIVDDATAMPDLDAVLARRRAAG